MIEPRASAMAWDPPLATGQPTAWPSRPRNSPYPPVATERSDNIEWAARPAMSPRASSDLKRDRASRVAGQAPASPNRASTGRSPIRGGVRGDITALTTPLGGFDERLQQRPVGGLVGAQQGGRIANRAQQ